MVLISNIISLGKYHIGLGKTGLDIGVVLILGGLNSDILLYQYLLLPFSFNITLTRTAMSFKMKTLQQNNL